MIAHLKNGRAELERTLLSENLKTIFKIFKCITDAPSQATLHCGTMLDDFAKFEEEISFDTKVYHYCPPSNQQYCGNLKTSLLSSSNFEEIVSFFLPLMTKLFSLICKHELNTVLEVLNHRLSGAC